VYNEEAALGPTNAVTDWEVFHHHSSRGRVEISSTAIPFEVRVSRTVGTMDKSNRVGEMRCESSTLPCIYIPFLE